MVPPPDPRRPQLQQEGASGPERQGGSRARLMSASRRPLSVSGGVVYPQQRFKHDALQARERDQSMQMKPDSAANAIADPEMKSRLSYSVGTDPPPPKADSN